MSSSNFCTICGSTSQPYLLILKNGHTTFIICSSCLERAYNSWLSIKRKHSNLGSVSEKIKQFPKNTLEDIYQLVTQEVKGQDGLVKKILGAINMHNGLLELTHDDQSSINKSNILIIGNTGTGKTLIASSVAKHLNRPYVIIDITSYTSSGYVGEDVENILLRLVESAGDPKRAAEGIIIIDEIDKIKKTEGHTKDVGGEAVQQALLKLTGGKVPISLKLRSGAQISFNPERVLFIFLGVFPGIDKIAEKRVKGVKFAFKDTLQLSHNKENNESLDIISDDLVEFGLTSEFAGRCATILQTEPMTKENLVNILNSNSSNSLIVQIKKYFANYNHKFIITEDAKQNIAIMTLKNKTGARGLNAVIMSICTDYLFDIPNMNPCSFTIDKHDTLPNQIRVIINYA